MQMTDGGKKTTTSHSNTDLFFLELVSPFSKVGHSRIAAPERTAVMKSENMVLF